MGFDIAMEDHSWSHMGFILFSIVSLTLKKGIFLSENFVHVFLYPTGFWESTSSS